MARRLEWEQANRRELVQARGGERIEAEPEGVGAAPSPPAELARQFRAEMLRELAEYSRAKRRGEGFNSLRMRSNHIFRIRRELDKALRLTGIPRERRRPPRRGAP